MRVDLIELEPLAIKRPTLTLGQVFYRVDGSSIGDEVYEGMELEWTTYRVFKVTLCGGWLKCVEWSYKKPRFALASGARWCAPTKEAAIKSLIARKVRHLRILESQKEMAEETLALARAAATTKEST